MRVGSLRGGTLWAVSVTLMGAAGSATPPTGATQSHTITIENMQFSPAQLAVHRGDRIVWVNKDLFPHTATANNKAFDSGSIAAGSSWTYVANKPGDYAYGCTFHPTMKGALKVQ
jgi:plastocyanin